MKNKLDTAKSTIARQVQEIIELKEQKEELVGALKEVRLQVGVLEHNWGYNQNEFMPKVLEALKNAKK